MIAKTEPALDPEAFRQIMARYPGGLAVLTLRDQGEDRGITVNSLVSVSLDPPSILVSLAHNSRTLPVLIKSSVFGVNLLSVEQQGIAQRFAARPLPPKPFRGIAAVRSPGGVLLFRDSLSSFEAGVDRLFEIYDHTLIVAKVRQAITDTGREALVYQDRRYARLTAL